MNSDDATVSGMNSWGTLDRLRGVDRLCRQFEDEWNSGRKPAVEAIIAACDEAASDPELHDLLLTELIIVEVMLRIAAGESPQLKSYLDRFGSSRVDVESAFQSGLSGGAGEAASPDDMPVQIGDYRIVREIGRGGMGIVYEAEQISLRRHVALKTLLRRGSGDQNHRRRFDREARAIARLHHTNIVDVFGNGEHQGMPFFAMRLIDGAGLDILIRQARSSDSLSGSRRSSYQPRSSGTRPQVSDQPKTSVDCEIPELSGSASSTLVTGIPEDTQQRCEFAASVGVQIALALQYAHERGVVHRDLKPSNILMDSRGSACLTDFGLARLMESETEVDLTGDGRLLGTLRYLPPECIDGPCGPAGDQYSLGLTLYEIITLRPAYERTDTAGLIADLKQSNPPRLNLLQPTAPADLVTIIHKAIDREPSARYSTSAAFAEDLSRFLNNEPILARQISAWEKLRRWSLQNRVLALSLATVASLLIIVSAGSAITAGYLSGLNQQLQTTVSELTRTTDALTEKTSELTESRNKAEHVAAENIHLAEAALAAREVAEDSVYFSRIALADQAWQTNDVKGALSLLQKCEPVDGAVDRRDWEFGYLSGLCQQQVAHIKVPQLFSPDFLYSLDYSPDGRWLAVGSAAPWDLASRSQVGLHDLERSQFIGACGTELQNPSRLQFSEDGELIGVFAGGEEPAVAIDRITSALIPIDEGNRSAFPHKSPFVVEFNRDATSAEPIFFKDRNSMAVVRSLRPSGSTQGVAVSEDGKLAATTGDDSAVRIWNLDDGTQMQTLRGHTNSVVAVAFDPVNLQVATSAADGIRIWDLTRQQQQQSVHVPPTVQRGEDIVDFAFSRDGRCLTAVARARGQFTTGTAVIDTGELLELKTLNYFRSVSSMESAHVTISVPGASVLIPVTEPDGGLAVCDLHSGRVRRWLQSKGPHFAAVVVFSDSGRLVATALHNKAPIQLWDTETGQLLHELPFIIEPVRNGADGGVSQIAFSPTENLVAVCYGHAKGAHVWDTASGTLVSQLRFDEPQETVDCVFSGDGSLLAVSAGATSDRVVVFDVKSGKQKMVLSGPNGRKVAAFSPTSPRLAVVGTQGPVYLWDTETGQLILRLNRSAAGRKNYGFYPLLRWSTDGNQIAANDWTGRIDVWDASLPSEDPVERRNAAITRSTLQLIQRTVRERESHPQRSAKAAEALAQRTDLTPPVKLERGLMWLHLRNFERAASDLLSGDLVSPEQQAAMSILMAERFDSPDLRQLEEFARICPEVPAIHVALSEIAARRNHREAMLRHIEIAVRLFEKKLTAEPQNAALAGMIAELMQRSLEASWRPLKVLSARSAAGAQLKLLDDGSLLASGENAAGDVYTIELDTADDTLSYDTSLEKSDASGGSVAAIRLEVLPDSSLHFYGPGRHESGNFQLQEFLLFHSHAESSADRTAIPLVEAWASFQYPAPDVEIAGTIKSDDKRVWHVWSRFGKPSHGVYVLEKPVTAADDQSLIVELHHRKGDPLNIGRFRLSAHFDPLSVQRMREGRRFRHFQLPPFLSLALARFSHLRPEDALNTLPKEPETDESFELAVRYLLMARASRLMGNDTDAADGYRKLLGVLQKQDLPPAFHWLYGEAPIEASTFLNEDGLSPDVGHPDR